MIVIQRWCLFQFRHRRRSWCSSPGRGISSFPVHRWRSQRWTPHATSTSGRGTAPRASSGKHPYDGRVSWCHTIVGSSLEWGLYDSMSSSWCSTTVIQLTDVGSHVCISYSSRSMIFARDVFMTLSLTTTTVSCNQVKMTLWHLQERRSSEIYSRDDLHICSRERPSFDLCCRWQPSWTVQLLSTFCGSAWQCFCVWHFIQCHQVEWDHWLIQKTIPVWQHSGVRQSKHGPVWHHS